MIIKFSKLNENAKTPHRGSNQSAGYDLHACIENVQTIKPTEFSVINTGIFVEIPEGFFAMVCPRSGLSAKFGITVLNSPGIIDSDYRGEIKCILINHSNKDFQIENEMRIAQLIVQKYEAVSWEANDSLSKTQRGENGFGSTGL